MRCFFKYARLTIGLITLAMPQTSLAESLSGPVVNNGLTVELVDLYQVPFSSPSRPHARINFLREPPDDSGRLFVNDMIGPLYLIEGGQVRLYMDLRSERPLLTNGPSTSSGFVSFAFHPDFEINGLLYTIHSEYVGSTPPNLGPALPSSIDQHSVLTEWQVTDPGANVFSGSSRELMRIAAPKPFHPLGEVAFRPGAQLGDADYGLLYLAGGDYGTGTTGQPEQLQRLDTPFGTVMRIDPLGGPFQRDGTEFAYGIPPTNPYANDGDLATLGEIYAHGFRNGHRISWDTITGTAIVSDVGQGNIEEVNILAAGANYGWPLREGTFALDVAVDRETVLPLPVDDAMFGFHYPAAQYDHEEGLAIAGGFVYRGTAIPDLQGQFVFGDIVSGRMLYADVADLLAAEDGDPSTTAPLFELNLVRQDQETTLLQVVREALGDNTVSRTDLRFGIDQGGEIYVTTKQDGFIRKLMNAAAQDYSDDFDRSALGPDWLVDNLEFAILGNELLETAPRTNAPAQMRWKGGDVGGNVGVDQYGKIQIRGPLTTTPAGFILRANAPTEPLAVHYEVHFKQSSGQWRWEYYNPFWQATLGACAGDRALSALDWIGVKVSGSGPGTQVSLYRWDADPDGGGTPNPDVNWGLPDCVLQSPAGPFADTGEYGGIRFYGSDSTDSRSDNWSFGTLVQANTPPADALRGGLLWDRWWVINGAPEPTGTHPLYPGGGQQQGSSTFRCKECHGWDYKGVDGAYAAGSHATGIGGVTGSTLTPTEMFDLIRSDSVQDAHGFANYGLAEQDTWDLIEFLQNEVIDTDTFIDPQGYFLGDELQGESHYATGSCNYCHGDDGTAINFGTPEDPAWVGTLALNNPWEFLHKVRFGHPGSSMPSWLGIGGSNQGASDIGLYAQTSLPIDCGDVGAGICASNCSVDTECNDGSYCNGVESCAAGVCVGGALPCQDIAHCDEGSNLCLDCVSDIECDDSIFCNGAEQCSAGSCVAGTEPCLDPAYCDESAAVCLMCLVDAECDDGISCNGFETCSAGVCAAGAELCPGGICDEASQTCAVPAFAQYGDDFDRASLGSDWAVDNLEFSILGDELAETAPKTYAPAQMRWQGGPSGGHTGTSDQYAKIQIGNPLSSTPAGFIVRANVPTEPLAAHYEVHLKPSSGEWRWEYYNPFWQATLASCTGDGALSGLDWIGVTITGSGPGTEVSLYRWDTDPDASGSPDPATNWGTPDCVLQSASGPFADGGSYGGLRFYGSDPADSRADNWSFGGLESVTACSVDADCHDGVYCNGVEACAAGVCVGGVLPCQDIAHCDEGSNLCLDCVSDIECDDSIFCNGAEQCTAGSCVTGTQPCFDPAYCDEGAALCLACLTDTECDDGISCNGFESCSAGVCAAGAELCPGGICDEASQTCTAPTFPQYSDDFDRASLGSDWVVDNLEFSILGDELAETAPKTYAPAQMRWQGGPSIGDTGTPEQYAKIQIGNPLSSTPAGFIVRANLPTDPLAAHYEVHLKPNSGEWRWEYYNPFWQATLGSCNGDGALSGLDWIGVTITGSGQGTEVSLYRWDTDPDASGSPDPATNWGTPDCVLQSASGPFADGGSYGGLRFYGSDPADSRADNWSFGGMESP